MAVITNNKEVLFHCACCHREIIRPFTQLEFFHSRFSLPKGWGYWRVLTSCAEFCDNPTCQIALDESTVGYPIDNAPTDIKEVA